MLATAKSTVATHDCNRILRVGILSLFHTLTEILLLKASFVVPECLVHFVKLLLITLEASPHLVTATATPAFRISLAAIEVDSSEITKCSSAASGRSIPFKLETISVIMS